MAIHIQNYETAEAAFAVNQRGVIVSWNPAAEKAFSYPASIALGQCCWKLLCGEDANNNKYCCEFCPLREMAFQHEPVNGFHVSFKTGLAERKEYSVSCLGIFDESGNKQLLHICHPKSNDDSDNITPTPSFAHNHRDDLSQPEITIGTEGQAKMDCRDCKFKSQPFQKLTKEQVFRVNEHRIELSFKQGELLGKQGMLVSQIIYIRQGFAKLYLENDDHITILGIAKPATFIGFEALYGLSVLPFTVEAMTDTEVCVMDIHLFRELVLENSAFAKEIIEIFGAELIQSYYRMISLTTRHINSRFSELLFYMTNVLYKSNPFKLNISRKDMADLVSTSPESISRLLGEFKEQGIINVKGQLIEIIDFDKLRSTCNCESLLGLRQKW